MKRRAKDFIRTFGLSLGFSLGLSGLIIAMATVPAAAQKKYDTGITDTEIKIGNIMPYSGPVARSKGALHDHAGAAAVPDGGCAAKADG